MEKADFYAAARTDLKGPLDGIRVLEATTSWAGPMVGCLLGDYGADVIKVESPDGEVMRLLTPHLDGPGKLPLMNEMVNRNKQSLSLNINTDEGREVFIKLAQSCDIVVENFRPGTLHAWGLGYENLREAKQDIIYVSVSGFGQYGPHHDQAAYDPLAQAFTGWMSLNGEVDGPPVKAPTFLADDLAGLHGALAALAALHHRDQTGEGQHIDACMVDSVLAFSNILPSSALLGLPVEKQGNEFPTAAPLNTFECRNGWIYLAVMLDSHWSKFCEAMQNPELAEDERFTTINARLAHRQEVNQLVSDWCRQQDQAGAIELMAEAGIPVSPVNDFEAAARSKHVSEREMIQEIELSDGSKAPLTSPVANFSRTPVTIRTPAQPIGAQNGEILSELGISEKEQEQLREKGII